MIEWKRYVVGHKDSEWSYIIELKQDDETKQKCKEMLYFFLEGKVLIRNYDGDVFKAFANLIAPEMLNYSGDYNKDGVISQMQEEEGFYPLTEEHGIRLISFNDIDYSVHGFMIFDD